MFSRFWNRLGKSGLFLLLTYLLMAYIIVITIIIREELTILDPTKAISVISPIENASSVNGQVRNVFGDPIPYGVVIIGDYIIQADNTGVFSITNLEPGRYSLEIYAGDYARYTRDIQVEEGMNQPTIKYDTGLWPQFFLVDFHVFYKNDHEIFGIAGFANGTDDPIYIEKATLLDPQGEVITDILHDNDGFNYYLGLSNRLEIVSEPQKALKWASRMAQGGEFSQIEGSFAPGPYSLEVHYAFQEGHDLGQYQTVTITDHLDLDDNRNPHLPDNHNLP